MNLIFVVDNISPCYYDFNNIDTAPLGASEKCLLMISKYLACSKGYDVKYFNVHPSGVSHSVKEDNFQFLQFNEINTFIKNGVIPKHIFLRDANLLPQFYGIFKNNSNLYLILDNLFVAEHFNNLGINIPVTIVCKSKWHTEEILGGLLRTKMQYSEVIQIYNPIEIPFDLSLTNIKVDRNKLLFASSPHKGLAETIAIFKILKTKLPKLTLYIANPGYKNHDHPSVEGVVYLDRITPRELASHLVGSLCLFYPNFVYPETFGCICAEANALGVPVISHTNPENNFSALSEILINTKEYNQLINCRDVNAIFDKILELQMLHPKRPVIKFEKKFDLVAIGEQYANLLDRTEKLRCEDLTFTERIEKPLGRKKVLMIRRTKIAEAPSELAKAINKYSTKYEASVDCVPREGYDVLHYHNIYIPAHHGRKVIQFHSEPNRVTRKEHFASGMYPSTELVISQYHATLPEYNNCKIVRNVIDIEEFYKEPIKGGKIKIGFSPSFLGSGGYGDKGYNETKAILERLVNENVCEIDIMTGISLEGCLKRKAQCHIIIDQCINPANGYHRSGLEGICLGKMTICCMNKDIEKVLLDASGSDINPFENIKIEELYNFLKNLKIENVLEKGQKNREWGLKWWNPKTIVEEFEKIYDSL